MLSVNAFIDREGSVLRNNIGKMEVRQREGITMHMKAAIGLPRLRGPRRAPIPQPHRKGWLPRAHVGFGAWIDPLGKT